MLTVDKPIRILYVDAYPLDRELVRDALAQDGLGFQVTEAWSRSEFEACLAGSDCDVVLSELDVPGLPGLSVIDAVRGMAPHVPVVLVTSAGSEKVAAEALQRGAAGYVVKSPQAVRGLPHTVRAALERFQLEESHQRVLQELREREAHYRSLFEQLPIGLYRITPAGRFLDANPAAAQIFGFPDRETLLATPAAQLFLNPKDWTTWYEGMQREGAARGFEARARRADGTLLWVRAQGRAVHDEGGQLLYCEGSLEDITEFKAALEALQALEERYRAVAEASPDGVIVADEDARILYASQRLCRIHGFEDRAALEGQSLCDLVAPEAHDQARAAITRAIAGELISDLEVTLIRRDGSRFPGRVSGSTVRNVQGEPMGFIGLCRDITEDRRMQAEREQLQLQLHQAQKMEAMGHLAGGVAHDFNNMLTPIIGYSGFLLRDLPSDHPHRASVEGIAEAARRAAGLTRQLLLFSRREIDAPRAVDLSDIVREMERMLDRLISENISLLTFVDDDLPLVLADPGQMEQVLMNLVLNASDAMPDGGQLTVSTRRISVKQAGDRGRAFQVAPGMVRADVTDVVCLSVSDTGAGMDVQVLDHIFEPFFTTKQHGTGLGLAVVYGIVRGHGGWIEVASEPGRGTTFRACLPAASLEPFATEVQVAPSPAVAVQGNGEAVLVVEDEEWVRHFAAQVLDGSGYRAVRAAGVKDAIAAFEQHDGTIRLVFSDVVLPDGTALELVDLLAQQGSHPRVLLSSGYSDSRSRWSEATDRGIPFIQKPYTVPDLLQAVRTALNTDAPP